MAPVGFPDPHGGIRDGIVESRAFPGLETRVPALVAMNDRPCSPRSGYAS